MKILHYAIAVWTIDKSGSIGSFCLENYVYRFHAKDQMLVDLNPSLFLGF